MLHLFQRITVSAVAVAAICTHCLFAQATPSVDPEIVYPAHNLVHTVEGKSSVSVELTNPDVGGKARYHFGSKSVSVLWRYKVPGYTEGAIPVDSSMVTNDQYFRTSFRPTEVCCIDTDKLLVAGVSATGQNVVEEWTFDAVTVPPVTFDSGGNQVPPLVTVNLNSKRLVYRSPFSGSSYVGVIWRNWADPTRPFILELGDKKLMQLDLTTLTYVVAATVDGAAGLAVPQLSGIDPSDGFDLVDSGNLTNSGGAVYWLGCTFNGGADTLVLKDSNLDGTIDTSYTLDYTQWSASELSSISNYESSRTL